MNKDLEIINIVKGAVTKKTIAWAKSTPCTDEQAFGSNNGPTTMDIAKALDLKTKDAKVLLDKAAKKGLVLKSKDNEGQSCRWWVDGYLLELKDIK